MAEQIAEALFILLLAAAGWGLYRLVLRPITQFMVDVRLTEVGVQVVLFQFVPIKTVPYGAIGSVRTTTTGSQLMRALAGEQDPSGTIAVSNGRKVIVLVERNDGGAELICSPRAPEAFVADINARIGAGAHPQALHQ